MEGRIIISLDKPKVLYILPTLYPGAGLEGRVIISLDKPNVLYTSYFISQGRVGGEDNYVPG